MLLTKAAPQEAVPHLKLLDDEDDVQMGPEEPPLLIPDAVSPASGPVKKQKDRGEEATASGGAQPGGPQKYAPSPEVARTAAQSQQAAKSQDATAKK